MTTATQNIQFLEALIANAERLRLLLGEDWPFFREHLLSIQRRLEDNDSEAEIAEGMDDVIDLLIDTAAGPLVRELLAQSSANDTEAEKTRGVETRNPVAIESPHAAVLPRERLTTAVAELGSQLDDASVKPGYTVVPVYYATDRQRAKKAHYSGSRGELEFGVAEVAVPTDRAIGSLPKPRWWKLQFQPTPSKHVTVLRVDHRDRETFTVDLRAAILAAEAPSVLVFVHGYNVTFEDAARRAAQLAADLDYPGTPFLYSWPSVARTLRYTVDEANAEWTVPHLENVLQLIVGDVGARSVDIVAHSMGNRAVVAALRAMPARAAQATAIRHVVLAAPDVDAGLFRQLAANLSGRAERLTLYASSRDRALWLSKLVHGSPRAGDSGEQLVVLPGVLDTIDSTALDTSLLGHSYYGDKRSIVSDIFSLLEHGSAPPRFGMAEMTLGGLRYWTLRA